VRIKLDGVASVADSGQAIALSSASPDDTNSIKEPGKVIPVVSKATGLSQDFTRTFDAYSITILKIPIK